MSSKIITESRGWTSTLDESVCFGVYQSGNRFALVGRGSTPELARIDLAAQIASWATDDLLTALGELATEEIIHAALKHAEEGVLFYEKLLKVTKNKQSTEWALANTRRAAEALRNLISSMKEHTQ